MTTLLRSLAAVAAAAALGLSAPAALAGQQSDALTDPAAVGQASTPAPGWSLTPSLVMSRTFDDNVLLHGPGDTQDRDYINTINPRGDLNFHGARGDFSARYDGAFIIYNNLSTLNSYDQHGGMAGRRKLSKRNTFFFNASVAAAPTTELLQLSGVPFVRVGTFTDDVRAGVESLLSKRTTLSLDAHFEQARFDASQTFANLLLGGNAIGGGVSLRHRVADRTTLLADGDFQHATIGTAEQQFDIQHASVGIERQLTEGSRVFASGGISRLGVTDFGPPRTGPSWRLGFVEHYRGTIVELSFTRSYVPSFGFGGTTQNGDVTARIHLPITRRIYTQGLVSLQQQDPLVIAVPQLRSAWLQAAVGYSARPWVRIEAYFAGTRQTVGQPDALLRHDQFGIQVIASKPVRIR